MAEIIENTKTEKETPSMGKANAGLALGIIGTSLAGLMALGGCNGGILGGLFGNGCNYNNHQIPPQPVNANPLVTMDAEELYLERRVNENTLQATKEHYQNVIDFNKSLSDSFFAAYERDVKNSFDLYKLNRDSSDALAKRIDEVNAKVDVMAAIRPYQDALINAKIDNNALVADYNLSKRTCKMITGELVLPSTPTVTGFPSYACCCANNIASSTATTPTA